MSSLKDLASLIMVPSLVKDGRLDTVKPLGNSIIHPDATGNNDGTDGSTPAEGNFTFSRGSNLAATRLDVNGLIEKGRENLLLQSNSFSTSPFVTSNVSLTSGQSGYDGTNDAWELSTTGVNGFENLYQNISFTGVHTISIYAKAGSNAYLTIRSLTSDFRVQFKLDDGTHSATFGSPINTFMEDAGAGWYRCGFTANFSSASSWVFYPQRIGITDAGNIYIQDAQLESSMVATDYIETGASTAQSGILEDLPRLDYSGGASCPSLLLEPQRSNLIVQSEGFSTTAWTDNATNTNVTANATRSPEGVQNAAEIEFTSSSAKIYDQFTNVASSMHIGSVWLKNKDIGSIRVRIEGGSPSIYGKVDVNLEAGTLSNPQGDFTPTIEDYGDGWYRVCVGDTGTATIALPSFSFDYLSSTGSFYAYGAQVEAGSYPTSYIPTYGSAVTRSQDAMYKTGASDLVSSSLGTIFIETKFHSGTTNITERIIKIDDGTTSNQMGISRYSNNYLNFYLTSNGVLQSNLIMTGKAAGGENMKLAFSYSADRIKVFKNGEEIGSDTSADMAVGLSRILFGNDTLGNLLSDQEMKQLLLFPTALTDSECIALTTL